MLKFTVLIFLFFVHFVAFSQEIIKVDAGITVKDVSNQPVGINMNFLMDDDSYLKPAISTANALKGMGAKILRFPGGEKSDNYLWGQRPFTSANHTLALTGSCYWPNNDSRFTESDYKTLKSTNLDFNEFMVIAQQMGAQPLIVVNGDGHHKPASTCNGLPDRDSLILAAQEWVRYANLVKNQNIKYWMVGNETFKDAKYPESVMADLYRQDLILFARAMKAVDPTIKIIANGDSDNWWKIVLSDSVAASYIDYLGLSVYPLWNWTTGYEMYRTTSPNFTGPISIALNAVTKYVANAADRQRIRVITTEINAIDWGNNPWPNKNDLAHALITFDMIGKQILEPKLDYACLWNTRWVNNTKSNDIFDALSNSGSLQPTGQAVAIWGKNLLDSLVSVNSTSRIVSYATRSLDKLNVILINKDTVAHQVNLNISNFNNSGSAARQIFKGTSLTDTNPVLSSATAVSAIPTSKNSQYNFSADPASITVLSFSTEDFLLPVELLNFEVKKSGSEIKINWKTATEKNNAGFVLEVSPDAQNFRRVAFVPAQENKNSATTHYTYLDPAKGRTGTHYYRLKQIDLNGQETTYEMKSVYFMEATLKATIFPNPVQQVFEIMIMAEKKKDVNLWVADKFGKKILQSKVTLEKGVNRIPIHLNQDYPGGLYFLHVNSEDNQQHIKFIKI